MYTYIHQPPGATWRLLKRYLDRQPANYVSRTVMVRDNNVEEAMKVLNGIMNNEGMLKRWKLTRR